MMRIAHISDLHLSPEHKRSHIRRTRALLAAIAARQCDHVVVTGDITANGHEGDYEIARSLFTSFGLLDPARLSLVIGNHDVFGGVNHAEEILTFPRTCRSTDYDGAVREFRRRFPEPFARTLHTTPAKPFPYAKVVGELALIGINSIAHYSRIKNPLGSNGEVVPGELRRLEELLQADVLRGKRRIVLIHHHFCKKPRAVENGQSVWGAIEWQTMKLRKKKELLKLFAAHNVALVLHGHLHEMNEYTRGGIRFMNSGGSVLGGDRATFNCITVSGEGITTETVAVEEELRTPRRIQVSGVAAHVAA